MPDPLYVACCMAYGFPLHDDSGPLSYTRVSMLIGRYGDSLEAHTAVENKAREKYPDAYTYESDVRLVTEQERDIMMGDN